MVFKDTFLKVPSKVPSFIEVSPLVAFLYCVIHLDASSVTKPSCSKGMTVVSLLADFFSMADAVVLPAGRFLRDPGLKVA